MTGPVPTMLALNLKYIELFSRFILSHQHTFKYFRNNTPLTILTFDSLSHASDSSSSQTVLLESIVETFSRRCHRVNNQVFNYLVSSFGEFARWRLRRRLLVNSLQGGQHQIPCSAVRFVVTFSGMSSHLSLHLELYFATPRSLVSVLTAPLTYDTRIGDMTSELRGKVCGQ